VDPAGDPGDPADQDGTAGDRDGTTGDRADQDGTTTTAGRHRDGDGESLRLTSGQSNRCTQPHLPTSGSTARRVRFCA
jgi:hypothetical protein